MRCESHIVTFVNHSKRPISSQVRRGPGTWGRLLAVYGRALIIIVSLLFAVIGRLCRPER